jgi:predicted HTH domain antitoxin
VSSGLVVRLALAGTKGFASWAMLESANLHRLDWRQPAPSLRMGLRRGKTIYLEEGGRMKLTLELPDEIEETLRAQWSNLPRHALEALAIEAYRSDILTAFQVQEMLGLASRWETDEFLKKAQAHLHYSAEDLAQDLRTLRELGLR